MVTRGGGNFSVMAASTRAFRMGPSESAETGGPCRAQERPGAAKEHGAGFNAREVPKLQWPGMPDGPKRPPPLHMIKLTETREIAPYRWGPPQGVIPPHQFWRGPPFIFY